METYMVGFSSFTLHSPSLLRQIRFSPPFGAVKNRNRESKSSNAVILTAGSPLLFLGLTLPSVVSATLSWRAFGSHGFLLVVTCYLIGTVVTKIKMRQKESEGIAEKRKGRRGPNSVLGSGLAGCICALASIYQIGGPALESSWLIGFVASYCTKLSDTVSSEIRKAYDTLSQTSRLFHVELKEL